MRRSKQRGSGRCVLFSGAVLAWCAIAALPGCDGGFAGNRNRVDELPGGYFYRTMEMSLPRYEHMAVTLDDGTVFQISGTDERCFSSLDSCEIFDQKLVLEPEPPSKSGGWITTDFEGEDLRLQDGGRVFHTASRVAEGNVIVIGGAPDAILGGAYQHPEIFNRHTRKFTVISASLGIPRFHHTAYGVTEGEILIFGGQVGVKMTIVDPQYPPNDPRFIQEINTFPSTNSIEVFDSSLPSDDGQGDFMVLKDNNNIAVKLPGNYGRALHATVRIAGSDNTLGNAGDSFLCAGGIQTLSPINAPVTKLRRTQQGQSELQKTVDIYDGSGKTCFIAPGIFLEWPRAHGVNADNLGWYSDHTYDGYRGQSNTFMICGGSDDTLATWGMELSEGFAATFSGFGPGGGISLLRLEPPAGETVDTIAATLNLTSWDFFLNGDGGQWLGLRFYLAAPPAFWPVEEIRIGKYFSTELLTNTAYAGMAPINRVHTQTVRVLRRVYTIYGSQVLGMVFTGAGGFYYRVLGGQVEIYDNAPVAAGEYFDPNFNVLNGLFLPQISPYDLTVMRKYWHIKNDVPLPLPNNPGRHPNPTGIEGAWLITDGFVPGDGFEGYQLVPPTTASLDDIAVRFMEKGRAWHTVNILPGMNGSMEDDDDRVLFAGGGDSVISYGGMPVTPSAIIFVPPTPR